MTLCYCTRWIRILICNVKIIVIKSNPLRIFRLNFEFHISFALQSLFDMGHFGWMIFHSMCWNRWIETERFAAKLTDVRIGFAAMNIRMFLRNETTTIISIFCKGFASFNQKTLFTRSFVRHRKPLPQMRHLNLSFHASEWIVRWLRRAFWLADTLPQTPQVIGSEKQKKNRLNLVYSPNIKA